MKNRQKDLRNSQNLLCLAIVILLLLLTNMGVNNSNCEQVIYNLLFSYASIAVPLIMMGHVDNSMHFLITINPYCILRKSYKVNGFCLVHINP